MSSSDDMISFSIVSICFPSLKKFLSNPPSMISRYRKMDVVINVMVLLMLMVECLGSDTGGTNLASEHKQKLFEVFNETSLYEGDHAIRVKNEWNRRYPFQNVLNHRELYEHAWSVIEEKCEECERRTGVNCNQYRRILSDIHRKIAEGRPEFGQMMHEKLRNDYPIFHHVGEDLTWSLVHDWHRYYAELVVPKDIAKWTRVMKTSLLYIRDKVREEEKETRDEIKKRWIALYPQFRVKSTNLESFLKELDKEKFQPTREDMRQAMEKYESRFASIKGKEKIRRWKWSPQMQTDLIYIAIHLNARDRRFNQKLKTQWDQINKVYDSISEESLIKRLYGMQAENFKPNAADLAWTKKRYEALAPIDKESILTKRWLKAQSDIHPHHLSSRQREKLTQTLEKYKKSIKQIVEASNLHDVAGHETEISHSSPHHSYSIHPPEERSPPGNYYRPDLPRDLSAPIHTPPFFPELGYPPKYGMQHYPNMSEYDVGPSYSTHHPSDSGHSLGGRRLPSHEYYPPEFSRNVSASIHSTPHFSELGYPHDYSIHPYLNMSGYDVGASSSTPHPFYSGHSLGGRTPPLHEYQQPDFTQDLNASIHPSSRIGEFGYPPGYVMPQLPYEPAFDPYLYYPSPHPEEGSSSRSPARKPPES